MNHRTLALFCACVLSMVGWSGSLHAGSASEDLSVYLATLKKKFPNVSTITTEELASMEKRPVLIDVREEEEYVVSHLAGAIRATKDPIAQLAKLKVNRNSPIVVYCSVGYRSSLLAEKLAQAGFTDVRNLEGSIFAWANEDRPLVNESGPTKSAHPFDTTWGRFLEKSKWQWKPITAGAIPGS